MGCSSSVDNSNSNDTNRQGCGRRVYAMSAECTCLLSTAGRTPVSRSPHGTTAAQAINETETLPPPVNIAVFAKAVLPPLSPSPWQSLPTPTPTRNEADCDSLSLPMWSADSLDVSMNEVNTIRTQGVTANSDALSASASNHCSLSVTFFPTAVVLADVRELAFSLESARNPLTPPRAPSPTFVSEPRQQSTSGMLPLLVEAYRHNSGVAQCEALSSASLSSLACSSVVSYAPIISDDISHEAQRAVRRSKRKKQIHEAS